MDFVRCLVSGGPDDFVGHMQRFHGYAKDVDWPTLRQDVSRLLDRFRHKNVGELEIGGLANDLFALARRHRVHPIPDMALVLVGLVTAEGIGKQLHPENDLFQATAAFLAPLVIRRGLVTADRVQAIR